MYGFRVRVADSDGLAVLPGQSYQSVKLLIDAHWVAVVIQKDIAPSVG